MGDARQQSDETTISHSVKYLLDGIDLTGMLLLGLLLRAINSFCCKKLNCTEGEESRSFVLMLHTKGKYSNTLAYSSRAGARQIGAVPQPFGLFSRNRSRALPEVSPNFGEGRGSGGSGLSF